MPPRLRQIASNIALSAVAIVVSLLIAEVLTRALTHFPIHSHITNRVFDDRLLYRMDTNVRGIDSSGFRNPERTGQSFPKIAAIGDSFTYGFNVSRENSWPGQVPIPKRFFPLAK